MFGKLKNLVGDKVFNQAVEKIKAELEPYLGSLLTMSPDNVNDDAFFTDKFVQPAKDKVEEKTSGVSKMIPGFDNKFKTAMFAVRDELVVAEGGKVSLVSDYSDRLPNVLKAALKG